MRSHEVGVAHPAVDVCVFLMVARALKNNFIFLSLHCWTFEALVQ